MSVPATKAFAACALLAAAAGAQDLVVSGNVRGVTRWSGTVLVTGDVNLVPDARLEIAAGTVVKIAPKDGTAGGWHADRVEIHIQGQLLVEGSLETPVRFVCDDGRPDVPAQAGLDHSWHGIVLHKREDEGQRRNLVRGAQVIRAFAGVQVPAGAPLIEDCVFVGCGTGVESGSAYKDDRYYGVTRGHAAPELHRCRFARCYVGLYAEGNSVAVLDRCVFYDCNYGVGPRRKGISAYLDDPGSRLEHCGFLQVGTAIVGCSFVRDSWFEGCTTVLQLSPYHDRLATQIEQVVFERNLVHGEQRFVVGDTAVAREAFRGELRLEGSANDLLQPWPPLPPGLGLQKGSAAIGKALHGLDLGPARGSGSSSGERQLPVTLPGTVLRGMAALVIDPPKKWENVETVELGATRGKGWWGAAMQEPNGALQLRRAFDATTPSGLLAIDFDAAAAGTARLNWTGDVAAFGVACNGKVAGQVEGRKRFGGGNEPISFDHEAGRVRLLVRAEGWGGNPALAMSVEGDLTPVALAAPDAAEPEASVKASKKRQDVYLEVKFSQPVHWCPKQDAPLALVQIAGDKAEQVAFEWQKPMVVRLGPLKAPKPRTELTVTFPGLCDLLGRPVTCAPATVRSP